MYCKNCGKNIDDSSTYCINCGTKFDYNIDQSDDHSSFGFAILGFFIPIIGLILFLVYEGKKPKRAKSAGKGALIGFITKIVLSFVLVILFPIISTLLLSNMSFGNESYTPAFNDGLKEKETTDEILEKYVNVSFGEFKVSNNGYYSETSLDITVKNISETQCTYYITIEAIDANGARIETDMIYADRLGSGQEIYLTAFEYVEQDKINKFKNASFRVLDIYKYDY